MALYKTEEAWRNLMKLITSIELSYQDAAFGKL